MGSCGSECRLCTGDLYRAGERSKSLIQMEACIRHWSLEGGGGTSRLASAGLYTATCTQTAVTQ